MALTVKFHRLRVQATSVFDRTRDQRPFVRWTGLCMITVFDPVSSHMNLKCLLVSSDEKTVRILRRVLSDLEISVDHCTVAEAAIRKLTRQRFESIIVDCSVPNDSASVLKAAKSAPTNNRAIGIVLVDPGLGLRGGFDMGAHFVLHKPLSGNAPRRVSEPCVP